MIDSALLEHCVREDLNDKSLRRMAIIRPLKVVITNYPEDKKEYVSIENHNLKPELGTRALAFTRELYIEQEDFMEEPPGKFFRLAPGREVRLKGAYIIKCQRAVKDQDGRILYVECTYDPDTLSGMPGSERKVKGTLHWLSAAESRPAQFRLYDYLLDDRDGEDIDFSERLNENSLVIVDGFIEPALAEAQIGASFQFVRMGYFRKDEDSLESLSVFNRIVGLKDSWAKAAGK